MPRAPRRGARGRRAHAGAVALVVVVLASCTSHVTASSTGPTATTVSGATARFAEVSQSPPDFIFPFMPLQDFTPANVEQFQYLMYRPLYWFGVGASPALNTSDSLADPPVYGAGDTVSITLKPYRWSDGETLDAQDVMFWMNMLHAEKLNWAAYVPGAFPDDVVAVTVDSAMRLTFTLDDAYNPAWFTDNELSQITPMPAAWDVTAVGASAGSGGCSAAAYGTADLACTAVYDFLVGQAGFDPSNPSAPNTALHTYATNPLWQVVDGPWRLTSFAPSGALTMTPNRQYSGPQRATLSTFVEVPFSSVGAEQQALAAHRVDVGYLPLSAISATTSDPYVAAHTTAQPSGYTIVPRYTWAVSYVAYNFNSTGDYGLAGKIFSQLYVRQAMQRLVDQPSEIRTVLKGYGLATYGPVPPERPSPVASAVVTTDPYPYDPSAAVALLRGHGWTVVPGRTTTCAAPGSGPDQCGAGIPLGTPLAFTVVYAAGTPGTAGLLAAQKASWARAGIVVDLSPATANTVAATAAPCTGGAGCAWMLADGGTGWPFIPAYYPSGEEIFSTGAGGNVGSYSDFAADLDITQTQRSSGALGQYAAYLARQLPVVFEPLPASSLTAVVDHLRGVTPLGVLGSLTPEAWRWVG